MIDVREFFKRWPSLYYVVATIFGPVVFCGLSARRFLLKYPRQGMTLNLGSGPRTIGTGVTNVDIYPYPGVAITADACAVPLSDGSVARIVSDNVLEHVKDPRAAVAEMWRLLEPGGVMYVATPFLYPFHSSPSDYQRWTKEGLEELFKDFEIVEIGTRAGPFSAFDAHLCHLAGALFSFGNPTAKSLITNLSMFIFLPVKLPDLVFNYWPGVEDVASVLYCVVRKK
ncbi:class I SAM-dependent methyltransferase [Candidatus Kaiserbacteria bacterium]|nr:class I SAM-dependent methyltransferase [Candidatus Kaiserbacteria bacterium]